jgi:hypothetical protein
MSGGERLAGAGAPRRWSQAGHRRLRITPDRSSWSRGREGRNSSPTWTRVDEEFESSPPSQLGHPEPHCGGARMHSGCAIGSWAVEPTERSSRSRSRRAQDLRGACASASRATGSGSSADGDLDRSDRLTRPERCRAPSSSGRGHHPLKVETRVRIPLGLPEVSLCEHRSPWEICSPDRPAPDRLRSSERP